MPRILFVDDDPDFLAFAACAVSPTYETETALGSMAALECVLARPYDVIVSDVHMPGMSGFLLAEQVQRANQVRVLFASSRDHRGEALLRGGAGFLPKPMSPGALQAAVDGALALDARAPAKILLVEDDDVLLPLFATALEGFEVVAARSAEQALAKLATHGDIALVLTDHTPPRIDALALVQTMRQTPALARLPVFVHTAAQDSIRQDLCEQWGVERVMEKTAFLRFLLNTNELRRRALA